MRMNVKKLISLVLIICMIASLGLYGCSNKEKEASTDKAKGNASATSAPTASSDTMQAADEPEKADPTPMPKSSLTVTFSKSSGVYDGEFDLEITCDGDADIYYTTDGSDPTTSSTKVQYSTPIKVTNRKNDANYVSAVDPSLFDAANVNLNTTRDGFDYKLNNTLTNDAVDKCTVIRAAALDKDGLYTNVATNTYFVGSMADHIKGIQESCEAAGTSLAVISLSINYDDLFDPEKGIYVKGNIFDQALQEFLTTGEKNKISADTSRKLAANYTQKGKEWERNIHMDFFESDGTTTSLALAQDCGVRIQGNYSRSDLQKGFRLYARKEYGKSTFDYAVFGDGLKNDAGETLSAFKSLTLRNGGNTAFTTKFSDTYWQSLIKALNCDTQTSRPCVVYIDGEYWGLYVLQEDYSQEYFATTHGVNKDDVVLYKGDAEDLALGYKLDLGNLPDGETDESYYFKDLLDFFRTHKDLKSDADYEEFAKLVDVASARNYFAVQIWVNNKWDWPGKNWSLWKTAKADSSNPYADSRWRFCFYDVDFGGVMGNGDVSVNTIKEDNYKPLGLLDMDTDNPAVLIYAYLMTNEKFRSDFAASLLGLSEKNFKKDTALVALDVYKNIYNPLYDQFFTRYPGTGSADNSINGGYASYQCIKDFLNQRADHIQPMLDYVNQVYTK